MQAASSLGIEVRVVHAEVDGFAALTSGGCGRRLGDVADRVSGEIDAQGDDGVRQVGVRHLLGEGAGRLPLHQSGGLGHGHGKVPLGVSSVARPAGRLTSPHTSILRYTWAA